MSAILLCCVILLAPYASSAYIGRSDAVQPDDGIQIITKSQHILVEEVDRYGNSIIRDMELPDFDESEELREDKERREEQEREFQQEALLENQRLREKYGCEISDPKLRRKCLQQQKRILKISYQNMRRNVQRLMKEINSKLKEMGDVVSEESLSEDIGYTSGYSPGDVIRISSDTSVEGEPDVYDR